MLINGSATSRPLSTRRRRPHLRSACGSASHHQRQLSCRAHRRARKARRVLVHQVPAAPHCARHDHHIDSFCYRRSRGDSHGRRPQNAPMSRDSLHLRVLRSLPLYDQPASVFQQRRQAIYGERTKETYEDAAQRRALRQLQCVLPFAFASEEVGDGRRARPQRRPSSA